MRCEAGVGVDTSGTGGQPRIVMCGKPAEFRKGLMRWEIKLCDDCYRQLREKKRGEDSEAAGE